MDVFWPDHFPKKPLADGYQYQPLKQVKYFIPDMGGAPMSRREINIEGGQIAWSYFFPVALLPDFVAFWDNDLAAGTNQLVIMNDVTQQMCRLFFAQEYTTEIVSGMYFKVTLTAIWEPC
jgi:hypothetical protein